MVWFMVYRHHFSYIMTVSFIGEKKTTRHVKTCSHRLYWSSAPRGWRGSLQLSCDRLWLHI